MQKAIITLIALAVALTATAGIAAAQTPDAPPPLALEVQVENINDQLCVVKHNYNEWARANFVFSPDEMSLGQSAYSFAWNIGEKNKHPSTSIGSDYGGMVTDIERSGRDVEGEYLTLPELSSHKPYTIRDEYLYERTGQPEYGLTALPRLLMVFSEFNEYQHDVVYAYHTKKAGERRYDIQMVNAPFNWTSNITLVDLEAQLNYCIEQLHIAHDLREHRADAYERLLAKQNELAIAKDYLVAVREHERIETELTIQLIALNTEILETIISIEQTRLAGLERRAELMLEAATRDAARYEEWLMQSGSRFDELESKQAETARILAESEASMAEYAAEYEEAVQTEVANQSAAQDALRKFNADIAQTNACVEAFNNAPAGELPACVAGN